jgi:hypothetical protein
VQYFRNFPTVCSLVCAAARYPDQHTRSQRQKKNPKNLAGVTLAWATSESGGLTRFLKLRTPAKYSGFAIRSGVAAPTSLGYHDFSLVQQSLPASHLLIFPNPEPELSSLTAPFLNNNHSQLSSLPALQH